jgi:hypothetical protein
MVGREWDLVVLAHLAGMSLRDKTDQLTAALTGRFTDHDAFLVRLHRQVIDQLAASVSELTERIETVMTSLKSVPWISDRVAVTVIAETGADMPHIRPRAHLAPGPGFAQETTRPPSGGIDQSRPGNAHLKAALGNAVTGAARTNGCYMPSRSRRRATRSTALKALVATEHAIIISIWHMLTTRQPCQDLGADYCLLRDPERAGVDSPIRPHRTSGMTAAVSQAIFVSGPRAWGVIGRWLSESPVQRRHRGGVEIAPGSSAEKVTPSWGASGLRLLRGRTARCQPKGAGRYRSWSLQ